MELSYDLDCLFIQFQTCPGATYMHYTDAVRIFITESCCDKSCKPGLGQGFQFQVSFI